MWGKLKRGLICFIPNEIRQRFQYRQFRDNYVIINEYVDIQGSQIGAHARLAAYCQIIDSTIGAYSSIGRNSKINYVEMGKYCSVSWNTTVGATNHNYALATTHAFPYMTHLGFAAADTLEQSKTVIGHDVWIGCNCVIMPGVTVGDGAVIGAGAVVTRDVPAYAVAAGIPAKVIKYRFEPAMLERLQQLQWWDFPDHLLREHVALFQEALSVELLDRLAEIKEKLETAEPDCEVSG